MKNTLRALALAHVIFALLLMFCVPSIFFMGPHAVDDIWLEESPAYYASLQPLGTNIYAWSDHCKPLTLAASLSPIRLWRSLCCPLLLCTALAKNVLPASSEA